jgi:regulator of protease activity HflC (stomatin/prohibitin superfamily)
MAGDDRGVDDIPTEMGWVFYNPASTRVYEYPTSVQTYVWTADQREESPVNEEIEFNTKDGMRITADISLSYHLNAAAIPTFYVKFRNDDIEKFTGGYMRNVVRDAFNRAANDYTADEIYGPSKELVVDGAKAAIKAELSSLGVVIEQLGFIGAPRPPTSVLDAIERKAQAVQEAERSANELELERNEAKKKVAIAEGALEVAKRRAEENRVLAKSISKELIQWRQLELQEAYLKKWDGGLPGVLAGGENGSPMIYSLPKQ